MKTTSHPKKPDWNRSKSITVFGRQPVLEALTDPKLSIHCLHLAKTNRPDGIIARILDKAIERNIPVRHHDRNSLSYISKNGRQDQGTALDIHCPQFTNIDSFINNVGRKQTLLALDGITNPQNVGMIIRSVVAAGIDGILYPKKGVASLGPLVIKASAGTVFRARIIQCEELVPALETLLAAKFNITTLSACQTKGSLYDFIPSERNVFVLGNESQGTSAETNSMATKTLTIPMYNGVESLNVAVTAALVAFHTTRKKK